jgi:murein DD-endopeptidase MepM/ murein hydrolase activator NlpD
MRLCAGVTPMRPAIGILILAAASLPVAVCARDPHRLELPQQTTWGGLVQGRTEADAEVSVAGRRLRIAADGSFLFGVGRDDIGPIVVKVRYADRSESTASIAVQSRDFAIERVDGVPESTVNPPPEIAKRIEREQIEVARARERDDDRQDFRFGFVWPARGRISGVYGSQRVLNGTPKNPHYGVDVAAKTGTPILAPAGGIVSFAKPDLYLTGGTVILDHGHGLSSVFVHLSRLDVEVGQRIEQGQRLGLVGATGRASGPHLHWGMNWFDVRIDPELIVGPM